MSDTSDTAAELNANNALNEQLLRQLAKMIEVYQELVRLSQPSCPPDQKTKHRAAKQPIRRTPSAPAVECPTDQKTRHREAKRPISRSTSAPADLPAKRLYEPSSP